MTDSPTVTAEGPPVARLVGVTKHFSVGRGMSRSRKRLVAVDRVDLDLPSATTVGLVGETGSGKSTVARLLLRLIPPSAGRVLLEERDITTSSPSQLRTLRRKMQLVFQDPYSSFDPTASIANSLTEALRAHTSLTRLARSNRAAELLDQVGLPPSFLDRRPRELSGGQLQRAAVARALAVHPSLIALDEPVSSLDVSTQAQVINLLADLQQRLGVAYLFISHDLSVVRHVSHTIAVLYLGKLMETGPAEVVYNQPKHPYTRALLSAVPHPDPHQPRPGRILLHGDIPSPLTPPSGCRFRTRCPHASDICAEEEPPAVRHDDGTTVHCHLYADQPSDPHRNQTPNGGFHD